MKRNRNTIWRRLLLMLLTVTMLSVTPSIAANAVNENGAIARGIDVSMHNGHINWGQVAASGVQFTFIKVGSTNSGVDPNFAYNITNASAAGLGTGVYLYSYATTPEQAAHEANLVLQWIDGYTVNYPVVYDIENQVQKNLSQQEQLALVNAFCSVIDAAGYYPMVYSYKNWFVQKMPTVGWDKWVAQYNSSCDYNNNVCFWQHTSSGSVSGISGRVDLNYQYKDYSSLIIPEGFLDRNGATRFYSNWRMQRGWVHYNETKYYLDGAGNLVRGWYGDESGTYYLTPGDGQIARGQCQVEGADYYFTAEGVKTAGWVTIEDRKYYYEPSNNGIMKRDWYSDEKGNYYFLDRTDGHMITGAVVIDKNQYYFSPEGIRMTGMVAREDGTYYYEPATGQMMFGWLSLGENTYFADAQGHIVTGAYVIDKQTYYFGADGILLRNQAVELEGVPYVTNEAGVLMPVEVPAEVPSEVPAV